MPIYKQMERVPLGSNGLRCTILAFSDHAFVNVTIDSDSVRIPTFSLGMTGAEAKALGRSLIAAGESLENHDPVAVIRELEGVA